MASLKEDGMNPWVVLAWVAAMSLAAVIVAVAVVTVWGLLSSLRKGGQQ